MHVCLQGNAVTKNVLSYTLTRNLRLKTVRGTTEASASTVRLEFRRIYLFLYFSDLDSDLKFETLSYQTVSEKTKPYIV